MRCSPRAARVRHHRAALPPGAPAELRSLLDTSPVGAAAERAERAARDAAQRAVSPEEQQQLAGPLSVHITSAVDSLQSVRAGAPMAGLSSAAAARVRGAQPKAVMQHAPGHNGVPSPFRSRLGSAPPGGRRTPSRGPVPEPVERESRRPRSAMDVRGPSTFALSQPPLRRPVDRGGFAVRARPRSALH